MMSEGLKQYLETIQQLIPISELSHAAQNDALQFMDLLELKKKKFVFKQGDKDNYAYYILEGELDMLTNNSLQTTIEGGTENAKYAIAQLQPRQFSARAKTAVKVLRVDKNKLERLVVHEGNQQTDDAASADSEMVVSGIKDEESGDWMTRMLQSDLFSRLPMANIQQLFAFLEPLEFQAGDTVIKQGESGDSYYIIQEGKCEVTRTPKMGEKPVKLAELVMGDSFGEEALLSDTHRNATVIMLTDGILMQLSKDNFAQLIKNPSVQSVSFKEAEKIIDGGGRWVDVRFPKEYEVAYLEDSVNIPLNALRLKMDSLDREPHYVVCCDTGGRSSAAAFLLTKHGFHVTYLKGGFDSSPAAVDLQIKSDKTIVPAIPPKIGKKTPPPQSREEQQEKPAGNAPEEKVAMDSVDTEAKMCALEADLAKNTMELRTAENLESTASDADEKLRKAYRVERGKLEQERAEIEKQRKLAEDEINQRRRQEEERIKQIEKRAEAKLFKEKKKLEDVYNKSTEQMKKLREKRAKLEQHIDHTRKKLEKQTEALQQKLEAAKNDQSERDLEKTISRKTQVEKMKMKIEADAKHQRAKQAKLENIVKAKAKAMLEQKRRDLAEQVAKHNEELEEAKRLRKIAEAGRAAAREEAKKIIQEYEKKLTQTSTASSELQSPLDSFQHSPSAVQSDNAAAKPKDEKLKVTKPLVSDYLVDKKDSEKLRELARKKDRAEHLKRIRERAAAVAKKKI